MQCACGWCVLCDATLMDSPTLNVFSSFFMSGAGPEVE